MQRGEGRGYNEIHTGGLRLVEEREFSAGSKEARMKNAAFAPTEEEEGEAQTWGQPYFEP